MRRITRSLILTVIAAALVGLLPGSALAATKITGLGSLSWSPNKVTISGGRVVWKVRSGGIFHHLRSTSNNWDKEVLLLPGERTSFHFSNNGTYRFKCTVHNGMTGKVVVS